MNKRYGRVPDRHDTRDRHFPHYYRLISPPLPPSVDVFSGLNIPVFDQGNLGSCTANCWTTYREYLTKKFGGAADVPLSRLYLYYQERKLNGDTQDDSGAQMRDGAVTLESVGVCPESMDPYNVDKFADFSVNDSPGEAAAAAAFKIGAYHRINDVDTARSCLVSQYPVALGFTVYSSFEDDWATPGMMPIPAASEEVLGGHAVCIHGYDDTKQAFLVRNSWGSGWALNGDFWMPYAFLRDTKLSDPDLWMSHLGKPW